MPQERALAAVLRCVARGDEQLCRLVYTRLQSILRRLSRLAAQLKDQVCSRAGRAFHAACHPHRFYAISTNALGWGIV